MRSPIFMRSARAGMSARTSSETAGSCSLSTSATCSRAKPSSSTFAVPADEPGPRNHTAVTARRQRCRHLTRQADYIQAGKRSLDGSYKRRAIASRTCPSCTRLSGEPRTARAKDCKVQDYLGAGYWRSVNSQFPSSGCRSDNPAPARKTGGEQAGPGLRARCREFWRVKVTVPRTVAS